MSGDTVQVHFRAEPDLVDRVDVFGDSRSLNRSSAIRFILRTFFERLDQDASDEAGTGAS